MKPRRVPVTLQVAQTECGLCCARSLLAAHGRHATLAELREIREPGRDGLSLQQVSQLLREQGMETRMYRVKNRAALEDLPAPYIAFWMGHHYVVVEARRKHSVTIMDPAEGRKTLSIADFEQDFSDAILLATPTNTFERKTQPVLSTWRNKPLMPSGSFTALLSLLGLGIVTLGFSLAVPVATQRLVDSAATSELDLRTVLVILAGAAICYVLLALVRTAVSVWLSRAVSRHLLSTTFGRLMRLPYRYFLPRPPGEIVFRLNSLAYVQEFLTTRVVQAVLDTGTIVVLSLYVLYQSPQVAAVVFGLMLLAVLLVTLSQHRVKSLTDAELQRMARAQHIQLDAIVSIANIRMRGYHDEFIGDWGQALEESLNAMMKRVFMQQGIVGAPLNAIQTFGPITTAAVAVSLFVQGGLTIGEAVAILGVSSLLFSVTISLSGAYSEFLVAGKALDRAEDIFETVPESGGGQCGPLPSASLSFTDVDFRYSPGDELALQGVSFDVAPGSTVALVGSSGSGKSTIARIATTLYTQERGSVRYGGTDIGAYDLQALRRQIGYVPQEGHLHNRSIVDNLRLGSGQSEQEVIDRCRALPFMGFVDSMPMGYHTVLSNMGSNLSGGQRQRLLIARALLADPKVVVLDEATSALDNHSQAQIYEYLDAREVTVVLVAHRLSAVQHADEILVVDGGRIVERGTHQHLLDLGGSYYDLYRFETTERVGV